MLFVFPTAHRTHFTTQKKDAMVNKEHYNAHKASSTIKQQRGLFLVSDQVNRSCIRQKEKKNITALTYV